MNLPRHRCLAFAAVCLLGPLPCTAQEGASVTLRFLSFPKAIDPKPVELLVGERKTIQVEIPSNELSPAYKVAPAGVWAVGETVAGPDGKPVFKEFGRAKALASPEQLVLLVGKGQTRAEGFELIPIDNRGTRFGGGKFLFLNAAKIDVAGVIGDRKFVVKPGQHLIAKPATTNAQRICHAEFWYRSGDKVKPFFSSTWPVSENVRGLVFFYHDPGSQHLRLHTIRDFESPSPTRAGSLPGDWFSAWPRPESHWAARRPGVKSSMNSWF